MIAATVALLPQLVVPRIERAASDALHTPVRIGWLGMLELLRGEVVAHRIALGDDDALTVARLAVRPELAALLDGRIVLERITIVGLDGTVAQDASGRPELRGLPFPEGDGASDGPPVTVQEIALDAAKVVIVPPPALRRTPLTLAVDSLVLRQVPTADQGPSWEGDLTGALDGVPLAARARADRVTAGTRITAEADLTGATIDGEKIVLPPGFLGATARASGKVAYELDPERKRDRITADLDIADLRLAGAEDTSLAARSVRAQGVVLDLASGSADLGRITIDAPQIAAALTPSGLVYPGLVPALVESGVAPPRSDRSAGWRIVGGRIDAQDGTLAVRRGDHQARLELASFTWRDVASGRRGDLKLALRAPAGGAIEIGGRLGIDPPELDASVALSSVALPELTALLELPLALARGTASGTLQVTGDPGAPRIEAVLDVSQLHTAPPPGGPGDRVLAVDRLETRLTVAPGAAGEIQVASLRLGYPYAMIVREPSGVFPLSALAGAPSASPAPAPQPAATAAVTTTPPSRGAPAAVPARRTIRIAAVTLDGGRLDYVDRTTTPAYWMGLAAITGIAYDARIAPGALGRLDLAARQDELHPVRAAVRRSGEATWQGEAHLDALSLPTLNPYLVPVLGYEAQTGTVTVDLQATLDGQKLVATSAFALDDVGVKQTGLDVIQRDTGVPLTVALSLLKDVGGEIALDVPVEVDTTTGRYALGSFVTQAIGRAVLGALSSPLRWLGMLFGKDGPPHALAIDPVPFAPGSGSLDAAAATRVTQIARILQSHADLDVILKAQVAAADRDVVGAAGLAELAQRRVEAVRSAFASTRDEAPILPSRLVIAPWTAPAGGQLDAAPAVYVELQSR